MMQKNISIIILTLLVVSVGSNVLVSAYAEGMVYVGPSVDQGKMKTSFATSSEYPGLSGYIDDVTHTDHEAKTLYNVVVKLDTDKSDVNNVEVTISSDSGSYSFTVPHMGAFSEQMVNVGMKASNPSTFKLSLG